MELEKMTIEQLKALAFDQIVERDRAQQNITIITNRIAELQKAEQEQKESKAPSKS